MKYGYKFPRCQFWQTVYFSGTAKKSLQAAVKTVEKMFAPGTTTEPYVQLVSDDGNMMRVIAEYVPRRGRWISPLVAEGLV